MSTKNISDPITLTCCDDKKSERNESISKYRKQTFR